MVNPISSATQAQAAPESSTARQPSSPAKTQPNPADTVQLSSGALAARAVVQELTENRTQTAQEARAGDVQARNLLAREVAANKG